MPIQTSISSSTFVPDGLSPTHGYLSLPVPTSSCDQIIFTYKLKLNGYNESDDYGRGQYLAGDPNFAFGMSYSSASMSPVLGISTYYTASNAGLGGLLQVNQHPWVYPQYTFTAEGRELKVSGLTYSASFSTGIGNEIKHISTGSEFTYVMWISRISSGHLNFKYGFTTGSVISLSDTKNDMSMQWIGNFQILSSSYTDLASTLLSGSIVRLNPPKYLIMKYPEYMTNKSITISNFLIEWVDSSRYLP